MPFKKFGLCDELVQGILATGYTAPTEIQSEAIPIALRGKDMIGCAQTGTGKTAAFVLPILNRLAATGKKTKTKRPRSLIVTPTRELAMQIDNSVKGYGRFTKIKSIAIYGGSHMEKQIQALRRGVDIISATPGRLLDHINRGTVDLSAIEVLVLDEADRMLDMGFIDDIKKIIEKIPSKRQTLLFSATISKEVATLTKNIQHTPKMVQIGRPHNPIDTITQHIYPVLQAQKMELLLYMIKSQQMYSVLVFSRTKRGADRICRNLKQNNIRAESIHSDRTQRQRMRALDGFKRGQYQVMVATDVAARGINVEGISHVFNYDVPMFPEDYVHRIGRTGRAEATGEAITFVSQEEVLQIQKIERFIGRTFKAEYYGDFEYKPRIGLKAIPGASGKKGGRGGGGKGSAGGRRPARRKGGSSPRKKASAKHPMHGRGRKQEPGKSKKKTVSSQKKKSFKKRAKPNHTSRHTSGSFKRSKKKKR
jgi:ATP-dependent RNA helicase RhlE